MKIYQVADLWFDSRADLDAALASPERKVSADDVKRFPEFRGQNQSADFRGQILLAMTPPGLAASVGLES